MPVLGQGSELVAQRTETVALLTQDAAIDGGVELDDLAQRPERAEQRRVVRLGRGLGRCGGRLAAERRGVDQGIARASRLRFRLGLGRCRRGRLRFLVDRIDFLRTQPAGSRLRASMLDSVIPPRRARISMTMRPLAL